MLRSAFFSAGLFVALWGVSFLMIDKLVMHSADDPSSKQSNFRGLLTSSGPDRKKVIDPPDWVAFSLMSVGTVTMLYSAALPKKKEG